MSSVSTHYPEKERLAFEYNKPLRQTILLLTSIQEVSMHYNTAKKFLILLFNCGRGTNDPLQLWMPVCCYNVHGECLQKAELKGGLIQSD